MRMRRHIIALMVLVCAMLSFSYPALAQFSQQGPKLVGTGTVGEQGESVSLSADGNTAIVGAGENSGGTGAAWIWTRSGGVWTQQGPQLVASDAVGNAHQGYSVSLSGDGNTAIVGGWSDNSQVGAAWIWTRSGGVWTQQGSKLVGSGTVGIAQQGFSVALSADGNTAIVGGKSDNYNGATAIGAAWVWTRSGGVWIQQGNKLVGSGAAGYAQEGYSVSLSADGNTAIVGGFSDNSGAGAAWVWTRSGGVWTQQGTKLVGSGAAGPANQGWSVFLSADGNTAIVGGQTDNNWTGAVWVWIRSAGVWTQQGPKLIGTGAVGTYVQQGWSVSLSGDGNTAIVGGNGDNNNAGAVWVWIRSAGVWTQQGPKLIGTGAVGTYVQQGFSVAISTDGSTAIVGGIYDNSGAGAAWVFAAAETTSAIQLPQTGQTACYDASGNVIPCAGTGQDGAIQAGVAWPNPRFSNSDGTTPISGDIVLDKLTGLQWTKNGGTPTVGSCTGGTMNWQAALDYVACLNSNNYLGHNDWRLPNINELESLAHAGQTNTAAWLNSQGFSNAQSYDYWSSTTNAYYSGSAWFVDMNGGLVGSGHTTNPYYVWPVRAGQCGSLDTSVICLSKTGQRTSYAAGDDGALQWGVAWPSPRFADNGDQTITDNLAGLVWPKDAGTPTVGSCSGGGNKNWQGALDYVTCLNTGNYLGHKDWRLPNRKELQSLIDHSQSIVALPVGYPFTNVQPSYWSSTTCAYDTNVAWGVSRYDGSVYADYKTSAFYVWPVRGGQSGTTGSISVTTNLPAATFNITGPSNYSGSGTSFIVNDAPAGEYTITYGTLNCYATPPPQTLTLAAGGTLNFSQANYTTTYVARTLSGTVRSATTGAVKGGATVTLSSGASVQTDLNTGQYSFADVAPGQVTLSLAVAGYAAYYQNLNACGNQTWDVALTTNATTQGLNSQSGYSKDPVNTATGNYVYQRRDMQLPGKGMPFVFERNYNSQAGSASGAASGPLGFGWTHNYNTALSVDATGNVTVTWGDDKTETYAADGAGGFTPQYGVFDTLIANADGTYTLRKKDLTAYNFDTSYHLTAIVDKNGNTIALTYTGSNLTQVTDTAGRNIDFSYDAGNRIITITDPITRTVQFTYDAAGNLATAQDANGNITHYTYDDSHQLTVLTDPRGNAVVTNVYDAANRVVTSQRDAKLGQTTYTYDVLNNKTTVTDALNNATVDYHDTLLRLIRQDDADGNSTHYEYDAAGNRTSVTDKNGNITAYTYDAKGNVLTKTDALNNVTTITYDANNNPLTRTDALGNITTFAYDANGNLTTTTAPLSNVTTATYDASGLPLIVTDARGKATTNAYDAQGNLTQITDALEGATVYTFDGVGRRLTTTNAVNKTTTYTYDDNNNLLTVTDPLAGVTAYAYDGNNNKISATDPMGKTTIYAYDVKDLLTISTDPLNQLVTYTYDALDRKTSATDKRGNTTTFGYDAVGNLVSVTDALNRVTTYTYDANGNKLTATDPLSHTTTYSYDLLNRVVSVSDPLANTTTSAYDALGRVLSTTNAKGQTTGFQYDAMGRLTHVTDANSGVVAYTYDANGNRLTMTDTSNHTVTYAYDDLNRLTQKTEPLGNTYHYGYDAAGNRISMTDAKGNTINYLYDGNKRLIQITYPDVSTVTFSYDANGNKTQMVDGIGTSTFAFDALNRMTANTNPYGKTIGYGYDANSNRTSLIYPGSNTVTYDYDALNRLASVTDWLSNVTAYTYDTTGRLTAVLNPNATTAGYTYDSAGRLTGLSNTKSDATVISNYSYTLDAIGNHTNATMNEPLSPVFANASIAYTYDNENRLTNAGGNSSAYDANGNLTARGTDTFAYDYNDRLVQSTIGGVSTTYGYDGTGNRLVKTSGTTTRYVLDINRSLSNVLAETDGSGNITAYYVYGLGLVSKVLPDNTALYYHFDPRGSAIALTDASQNITDKYAYNAFGTVMNRDGLTLNPFTYVGRYGIVDEGNGLEYIRARYYAPELGRFITKDPMTGKDGDSQSLNRYVYALNNPVRFVDVSGYSALEGGNYRDSYSSSDEAHRWLINDYVNKIGSTLTKEAKKKLVEKLFTVGINKAFGIVAEYSAYNPLILGKISGTMQAYAGPTLGFAGDVYNAFNDQSQHPERDTVETMARLSIDVTATAIAGVGDMLAPGLGTAASTLYQINRDEFQDNILHNAATDWAGNGIYNSLHGSTFGGWLGL